MCDLFEYLVEDKLERRSINHLADPNIWLGQGINDNNDNSSRPKLSESKTTIPELNPGFTQ